MALAPGCFFWPSFCSSFPWSQLCRISEKARWGSPWQIYWRQGFFSGLLFAVVSTGPNFAEFQKTRAGGPLGKFDIARLHGHVKRRGLQQNVLLGWHFKEMLVRTWWHMRQGVFSGLLFAVVSPGPNFAEFQKTRAGGPLGKFDIARLHGHFKRRALQQNVLLGWHFNEMLVRDDGIGARVFFLAFFLQ